MASEPRNYPDYVFVAYDEDFNAQTHDVAVSLEAGNLVGTPVKYIRHDLNTRPAPATGIEDLLKKAVAAFKALSPEKQAEMMEEQRKSFAENNVALSHPATVMASELKPCLSAFVKWTKQHHAHWNLSPVHINGQFSKFMDPDTDTAWMGFEAAWNTRPAPAATDTGLETSLWRCQMGEYAVATTVNKTEAEDWEKHTSVEEYVTRSQAEELLAAERARAAEKERLRFEGDLDKWMKIIGSGITGYQPEAYALMDLACQELVTLRADNAAKYEHLRHWQHKWAQSENERQALEAKLAAAEKALEQLRSDCQEPIDMYERNGPEFTSPHGNEYESTSYVMAKFAELVASIDEARAVLGGK